MTMPAARDPASSRNLRPIIPYFASPRKGKWPGDQVWAFFRFLG